MIEFIDDGDARRPHRHRYREEPTPLSISLTMAKKSKQQGDTSDQINSIAFRVAGCSKQQY